MSRRSIAVVVAGVLGCIAVALLTLWKTGRDSQPACTDNPPVAVSHREGESKGGDGGNKASEEVSLCRGIVLNCRGDPEPGIAVVARTAKRAVLARDVSDSTGAFSISLSGDGEIVELCAKVGEVELCAPAGAFVTLQTRAVRSVLVLVHVDSPIVIHNVRAVSESGTNTVNGERYNEVLFHEVEEQGDEAPPRRFLLSDICPGTYRVEIRTRNKTLAKRLFVDHQTPQLNLWWKDAQPLEASRSTVRLRLLREDTGKPLADTDFAFQVTWPLGGTLRGTRRTDSIGRAEFTTSRSILLGAVLEVEEVEGYQPWAMVMKQDHQDLSVDVALGWREWPIVTVLSIQGEELPGVEVRFTPRKLLEPRTTLTDENGEAMLVGMREEECGVAMVVAAYRAEGTGAMSSVESSARVKLSLEEHASLVLPIDSPEHVRVVGPEEAKGVLWVRDGRPESRWNHYVFRSCSPFVFAGSGGAEQWEFLVYAYAEGGRKFFGEHTGPRGSEHMVELREAIESPLRVVDRDGSDVVDAFAVPEALMDSAIVPRLFLGPPGYHCIGTRSATWHLSAADSDSFYTLRRTGHSLIVLSTAGATSLSADEQLSGVAVVDPLEVWVGTVSSVSGMDVNNTKITAWVGEAVVHTIPDRNGSFVVYRNGETEAVVEVRLRGYRRTVKFEQSQREYDVVFD